MGKIKPTFTENISYTSKNSEKTFSFIEYLIQIFEMFAYIFLLFLAKKKVVPNLRKYIFILKKTNSKLQ